MIWVSNPNDLIGQTQRHKTKGYKQTTVSKRFDTYGKIWKKSVHNGETPDVEVASWRNEKVASLFQTSSSSPRSLSVQEVSQTRWFCVFLEGGEHPRKVVNVKLFSLAMDVLIQSAEPDCRGPRTASAQHQPPIRAFIDDLKVTTVSVPARLLLDSAGAHKDVRVGPDVLQTSQIQIFGVKERERWRKSLVQYCRHSHSHPS